MSAMMMPAVMRISVVPMSGVMPAMTVITVPMPVAMMTMMRHNASTPNRCHSQQQKPA